MSLNLGQISGLYIGTSAPTNKNLIWFDSTPSVKYHKVYDFSSSIWEKLNKNSVSSMTYSELTTLANNGGLSLGVQYVITDFIYNTIAYAITASKIYYFDQSDNLIIDDLGLGKNYIVSSSNIIIDDLHGVFDVNTQKIIFSFQSDSFDGEDYAHAKGTRNSVAKLLKYKWKTIVSSKTNNSIVWDGGLFFNFSAALTYLFDKSGGIVSYEKFVLSNKALSDQLSSLSSNYQNVINSVNSTVESELAPVNFYSKQINSTPNASGAASDIIINDSLYTIISKIQTWINKFKKADGIGISTGFAPSTNSNLVINNSDTVDTAFRKLQKWINNAEFRFEQVGLVSAYAGVNVPLNWMLCDGTQLAISEYTELYESLGGENSPYGVNLGSSPQLFSLPNIQPWQTIIQNDEKTPYSVVAYSSNCSDIPANVFITLSNEISIRKTSQNSYFIESMNGASVSNGQIVSSKGTGIYLFKFFTFDSGETGGEKNHLLTSAESGMPEHEVDFGYRSSIDGTGSQIEGLIPDDTNNVHFIKYISGVSASHAHNNMPPYFMMKFIIKVR